jgi:mannonate dehydratase
MLPTIEPGIKVAIQASPEPSDEELALIRQMGVEWVVLWTNAAKASADYFASRRELFESHGIRVYGFGNRDVHNQDAIVLGLEGRRAKIEQYKRHLRDLSRAGIPYTTYAHMANGIWSTERELTRGGASARAFDAAKAEEGRWIDLHYRTPLSHGRVYSQEEIWDNFTTFIREVAPVAEDAGVRIGIHPDDPPWPELAGVPRCIFSSFDGYQRGLDVAASPNVGVCLCVGCWLEGGPLMGKDVVDTIHEFGRQRKLFKVHFRNVDRPLPHFVETFIDAGYMDMSKVMRALRAIDFDGVVIADHIPLMGNDPRIGTAYSIAYMKALVKWANEG